MKYQKTMFWIGIIMAVLLLLSFFIKINVDSGSNYIVKDSILGIIIFHNPFVLAFYILITVSLVVPFLKNVIG